MKALATNKGFMWGHPALASIVFDFLFAGQVQVLER